MLLERVMPVAVMVVLVAGAAAAPCPKGLGFWDTDQQQCVECKVCAPHQVVLLPCQPYKDTVCGPFSALNINWAWLKPKQAQPPPPTTATPSSRPPKRTRPGARKVPLATTTTSTTTAATTPPTTEVVSSTEVATPTPPPTEAAESTEAQQSSSTEAPTTRVSAAQPFLAHHETALEWDWTALGLAATVATFVVLLVVFAVYAAVHARRATVRRRRLQQDLDAAQLSLFPAPEAATAGDDAEMQTLDSSSSSPPPAKGMYSSNQCLYLEKLLEQKQSRRANIYVETGRQATPAPARRSSRWKGKQHPNRTP